MERGRGAVAATAMGADAARKQRRKAATENMVRGSLQSAAEAEATEAMAPVSTAIMKAVKKLGTEAEEEAVRRAAELVVVEAMQVEGISLEAARAQIADVMQAMGRYAAEAAIMEVV